MNIQGDLNKVVDSLLEVVVATAKQKGTYDQAIKYLKHEQNKVSQADLPARPTEMNRESIRLVMTIYGEAIYQLNYEAKSLPIKEE